MEENSGEGCDKAFFPAGVGNRRSGSCRNAWRSSGSGKRPFIVHSVFWSGISHLLVGKKKTLDLVSPKHQIERHGDGRGKEKDSFYLVFSMAKNGVFERHVKLYEKECRGG